MTAKVRRPPSLSQGDSDFIKKLAEMIAERYAEHDRVRERLAGDIAAVVEACLLSKGMGR